MRWFDREAVGLAAIATCLATESALAKQAAEPPSTFSSTTANPPERSTDDETDEILVTAQRREQRQQDVPITLTALSGNYLANHQIRSLQDLGASVPGLVVTSSVNYDAAPLSIRGIGGANGGGNVFGDEPVAVYVDDAFVARQRLSTAELVDVARVEVLRGPQGVYFGRNATAGAVLLSSAEPTMQPTIWFEASATTLNDYRLQGGVSGPLDSGHSITVRLAGGASDRSGWGTNSGGRRLNGGTSVLARGFLRFEPEAALRVDLIAEASRATSRPGTIAIADVSRLRDEATNPQGDNRVFPYTRRADLNDIVHNDRFALNAPTFTRTVGQSYTGRLRWDTGVVEVNLVTNYRRWQQRGAQDSDGTAIDPPTPPGVVGSIKNVGSNRFENVRDSQFSQEARLTSPSGRRFEWMMGGYYFEESNSIDPVVIVNALAGPGGSGTSASFVTSQRSHSYAVFANGTYALTPGVRLSLGGRYTRERKRFRNAFVVTEVLAFDPPGPLAFAAGQVLAAPPELALARTDDNFSPRIGIDARLGANMLGYASFSQGFKSGGFNGFRGVSAPFAPETVDSFEIGIKADPAPGVRLNLSAFSNLYHRLQARTPVATGGVGIENVDRMLTRGLEAELTLTPSDGLKFTGLFAYLDARFLKGSLTSISVQSYVFGATPPVLLEDVAGNRPSRAPEFQAAFETRYVFALSGLRATLQGSVRMQSGVYFLETQQHARTFFGEGWAEADARIAIGAPDDRWQIALFGKNLTDNRHFSQITALFALPNGALNSPRQIGIQLNSRF